MGLLPYQKLIRDASPSEQRVFRELQEGLLEAERMRAQTGRWPDVAALEAEGIPPFASRSDAEGRLHMDVRPAGLGDQLSRRAVRRVAAGVGARHSRARAGRARRSGAERRNASPAARRDDVARVDLEYAGREAPQRLRRAAAAAERWLDELAGGTMGNRNLNREI